MAMFPVGSVVLSSVPVVSGTLYLHSGQREESLSEVISIV